MIRRSAAVSSSGRGGGGGVDEASVDSDNTPLVSNGGGHGVGVGAAGGVGVGVGVGGGLRGRRLKSGSRAAPRVLAASDEGVRLDGDYRVEGEDGPSPSSWSSSSAGGRASSASASTTNRLLTAILVVLTVLVLLHANNLDGDAAATNLLGGDSFDEDPHALIERYDALRRQRESALASSRPDNGVVPVPESVVDSTKDTGVAEETKEEVPLRPVDDVDVVADADVATANAPADVATAVDATSAADTTANAAPDAPDVSATTTTATTTNDNDNDVSDAAAAAPAGGSRTVAYVLPVYDCPSSSSDGEEEEEESGRRSAFADAAAVLRYSVHRASVRGRAERADDGGGHYDYQMVALLHPCFADTERVGVLAALGYRVLVRDALVPHDQIRGDYLRRNVGRQRPDGDRDTVRFHAHALTEYPVVVALDARSLLLRPLDELFDALLAPVLDEDALRRIELAPPRDGDDVDLAAVVARVGAAGGLSAFLLRDTLSASPNGRFGVDPGLFVVRPSLDVHRALRDAYREGDFRPDGAGWAGKGHGGYRGAMTFKGLSAHYYDDVRPGVALELDRCAYNNVADRPTVRTPDGEQICRDRATVAVAGDGNVTVTAVGGNGDAADCEDCRERPLDRVRTINLSACRSPWDCFVHDPDDDRLRLCRDMHATWYRMRDELETNWVDYGPWGGAPSYVPAPRRGNATSSYSLNFCAPGERGRDAYAPMRPPTLGTTTTTTTGADRRRRRTLRANNQRND